MKASVLKKTQIPQTLQDLLEHQAQLSKARIEVTRLRALIIQHEGGARLDDSALLKAQQHRREVLADLATDKASQKDLAAADQAVATADADIHQQRRLARLNSETAAALEPRLEAAKAALEALQKKTRDKLDAYLSEQLQSVAEAFDNTGRQLGSLYEQLHGLEMLLKRYCGYPHAERTRRGPPLRLRSMVELSGSDKPYLWPPNRNGVEPDRTLIREQAEKALADVGIDLEILQ